MNRAISLQCPTGSNNTSLFIAAFQRNISQADAEYELWALIDGLCRTRRYLSSDLALHWRRLFTGFFKLRVALYLTETQPTYHASSDILATSVPPHFFRGRIERIRSPFLLVGHLDAPWADACYLGPLPNCGITFCSVLSQSSQ